MPEIQVGNGARTRSLRRGERVRRRHGRLHRQRQHRLCVDQLVLPRHIVGLRHRERQQRRGRPTNNSPCNQTWGGAISLDPARFRLCGDFDIRIDFELTTFPIPTSGSRYLVVRALQPGASNSISLERYDIAATNSCVSAREQYKGWTTTSNDCTASWLPSADATGTFRLTRVGTTVTAYHAAASTPDAGDAWVPVVSATSTAVPWGMEFYTGFAAGNDPADQTVRLSNLRITSGSTP
jgi:hypothetical protein